MTSFHFIARVAATAVTALSVLALPAVASAIGFTPRPDINGYYGDTEFGEDAITGRYQQVFPGTSVYLRRDLEIREIRLRPDSSGSFSMSFSDVEISLSTNEIRTQAVSSQFADNRGSDPVVVYSGSLDIYSHGASGNPRGDFDIVIDLDTAYPYHSSDGDLVLEWNNRGEITSSGVEPNFDAISKRFASVLNPDNAAASGEVLRGGLATRFTDGVIPEPSGALLFGIAALVTLGPRRRQ